MCSGKKAAHVDYVFVWVSPKSEVLDEMLEASGLTLTLLKVIVELFGMRAYRSM